MLLALAASPCCGADLNAEQVRAVLASVAPGRPVDLSGKSLENLDLSNLDFKRADVSGANFFGAKLVGVISHSDVSDKVAAENKCPAWMKASDIMTRELITVTPDMTLEDCMRLMDQNTIFHLLVLGEGQGFRGMLSISDILRVVASDEKARADLLESFIFPQR